jgi:hypothetical protein
MDPDFEVDFDYPDTDHEGLEDLHGDFDGDEEHPDLLSELEYGNHDAEGDVDV